MVLIYTDRLEAGINLLQPSKVLRSTKTEQSTLKLLFYQNSTVHTQPTLFYHDSQHSPHATHSVLLRQPAQSTCNPLCSTKTASTVHTQTTLFYQDSQHSPHSNYSILQRQLAQFTLKLLYSIKTAQSTLKLLCYQDSQHSPPSKYSILPR